MNPPQPPQTPLAELHLEQADTPFAPHDLLRGYFSVPGAANQQVRSAELSVVWYTAGKGEEDLGVYHLQRFTAEGPEAVDLARRRELRVLLPEEPLSYNGLIVKVCWCVRLRLFLPRNRQQVLEAGFQLGHVAAAQPLVAALPEEQDD